MTALRPHPTRSKPLTPSLPNFPLPMLSTTCPIPVHICEKRTKKAACFIASRFVFGVEVAGFEPAAFWSRSALKFRHLPFRRKSKISKHFSRLKAIAYNHLQAFATRFPPSARAFYQNFCTVSILFSVIPVICEMWFVSSYLAPCVDALRKNSLPVRNSSSVMSHNPTPYCLNHPRWKGLNPRRCPVPFQKLFHIGGDGQKQEPFRQKFPQF